MGSINTSVLKNTGFLVGCFTCFLLNQVLAYCISSFRSPWSMSNSLGLFTIVVQWIAFIPAGGILGNHPTEKFFDITGSLTFLSTLALSLVFGKRPITVPQIVVASSVACWALRLGTFLFLRIQRAGGVDSRFIEIKKNPFRFLLVWSLQGAWVFIVSTPYIILNLSDHRVYDSHYDYFAHLVFVFGFIIEGVADAQKQIFYSDPQNRSRWIATGLWAYSRHPNYFGEILIWVGIALSSFLALENSYKSLLVFISPTFTFLLLIFVSGIPVLEAKNDKRFGNNEYFDYKRNTPVLVPLIGRRGSARF